MRLPFFSQQLVWLLLVFVMDRAEASECNRGGGGCDLAFGGYKVRSGDTLNALTQLYFSPITIPQIMAYRGGEGGNKDFILNGEILKIPFTCDCIDGKFLAHNFVYTASAGDTYERIATNYSSLVSVQWLQARNSYDVDNIPVGGNVNVTVNCSCGDAAVSTNYGLFMTYPLINSGADHNQQLLATLSSTYNVTSLLLHQYNPAVNFSSGNTSSATLVFIPVKDANGSYRPLPLSSNGLSAGAIAGISIGTVVLVSLVAAAIAVFAKRKRPKGRLLATDSQDLMMASTSFGTLSHSDEPKSARNLSGGLAAITVDKSVEFSYEELSVATNGFSLSHKIGEGGFGVVYYAELRGEKAAVKKMDMEATREFLAELKVLTHVHHLNLVRLIGYCTEQSLSLVYEFIDNGNLGQHLRGSGGRDPLSWSSRVQIALDSARGLEYIHEHTVPVYIHRDIKSANILIDKNFRAKVADFGLAKLTEVGGASLQTRLVGTFGYMPPEYAQYGDVSPKIDVYAFGVVLYELISAKEAVIRTGASVTESKGLVALFDGVLSESYSEEELRKLVDPRLGNHYPFDIVYKIAQLARQCTHENPQYRPNMRNIVVGLMQLSSSSENWDVGTFQENLSLVSLMSGR